MNALRKEAEKKYEAALQNWHNAAAGIDVVAFEKADEALTLARKEAVAAAIAYPTYDERKRENNRLRLANRGLDI